MHGTKVSIVGSGLKYDMKPMVGTIRSVVNGAIYIVTDEGTIKFNLWTGRGTGSWRNRGMILSKASHKKIALAGWGK